MLTPQKLIQRLTEARTELAHATLTNPPPDYASFMRAVGEYQGLLKQEKLVREAARQED